MYLYPYTSVQVPSACKDASSIGSNGTTYGNLVHTSFLTEQSKTVIPLEFIRPDYTIPGIGTGVLLTSDVKVAVVVLVDYNGANFNSTLFLLSKSANSTIARMSFANDFLAASLTNNVLYLYNGGLGFFLNPNTGKPVGRIFSIDNYREVSVMGDGAIVQTTATIAGMYAGGQLFDEPHLNFTVIAYGCFI
jgi:hypothetical protein